MRYFILLFFVLGFFSCQINHKESNEYLITPKSFTEVQVTDNFWAKRIKTNHEVTIPIAIQKAGKPEGSRILRLPAD